MALLGHHLDKLFKTFLSSASYAEEDKIPSGKVARKHLLQNDFAKYHLVFYPKIMCHNHVAGYINP